MLRALQFFNILRFGASVFFLAMIYFEGPNLSLGSERPDLFMLACIGMLITSLSYFFNVVDNNRTFKLITAMQFGLDLLLTTFMVHASGSITSEMTMALFIVVAAGCVVLRLNYGTGLAVAAIILISAEHVYSVFKLGVESQYNLLAMICAGLLITNIIISRLARRARTAEAESDEQHENIIALSAVNNALIQDLDIGIFVVDENGYIRTSNPAAFELIGKAKTPEVDNLSKIHRELFYKHRLWLTKKGDPLVFLNNTKNGNAINVEFERFEQEQAFSKITLSNEASLQEKAHQMTLAAMGRMATGIAHEVRNPLTTISAANELLVSKKYASNRERKATQMIAKNCDRINHIIEEILTIGRSNNVEMEDIRLRPWLQNFLTEFCEYGSHSAACIKLYCDDINARFSRQHLHQVMANLCENGFRHSEPTKEHPLVIVGTEVNDKSVIDVISPGDPIDDDVAEKLFEPFFSTSKDRGGTGLGLYICKQICALNLSALQYIDSNVGNCFRITFSRKPQEPVTTTQQTQ